MLGQQERHPELDGADVNLLIQHNFDAFFTSLMAYYLNDMDFRFMSDNIYKHLLQGRAAAAAGGNHVNYDHLVKGFEMYEGSGRTLKLEYDKVKDTMDA